MQWSGQAWLGSGAIVFWGEVGDTSMHAHAAHQLFIGAEESSTIAVTLADGRSLGPTRLLAIPSGVTHRTSPVGAGARGASVYLDVDSAAGRGLGAAIADGPSTAVPPIDDWPIDPRGIVDEESASRLAGHLVGLGRGAHIHPYVTAAQRHTVAALAQSPTLAGVAAETGVSASHLSRLWRRDLGMSFNTWLRWERLREAARLIGAGANITDAAHGAGFADGAHASRVCSAMFGLSPLALTAGLTLI